MKKERKPRSSQSPKEQSEVVTDFRAEQTDPQGSYTGRPAEPLEEPIQDVDDL